MLRRLVVIVFGIALLAAPAGAAGRSGGVGRQTAASGAWRASLTYIQHPASYPPYSHLRLTVLDRGRLVLDAPVTSSLPRATGLQPGGFGRTHPTLQFRDLNGDGTKELLVSLFTGGAHCCFLDQIFDFSGNEPHKLEKDFGDPGATIETLGGQVVLRSADDSFAYAFTAFVFSGLPIELWRYTPAGRLRDVTRSFPAAIARDAAFWWKAYRGHMRHHDDVRGLLAAWAADEALLGDAARAKATLLGVAATGALDHGEGGAKGGAYVRALWRFLAKRHYVR